jgi:branched-chain amino acid transport system ATP-binding protein
VESERDVLLRVSDLGKSFGAVRALAGVSFELSRGGALGIIGPNGSGKSTLVNAITGFVVPSAGRVEFAGRDITGIAPHRAVDLGIARSFQMARPFHDLKVVQNLVVAVSAPRPRRRLGARFGDRDELALHLLEDVGFDRDSPIPYQRARELPHGYQKRLELARCLALDPELIILDELFSGMSMSEVASLLPLLERIRAAGGTLIMVEHRLRELFRVVDTVLVLDFGRRIALGTPAQVMAEPQVAEAYLGAQVPA